MHLSLLVVAADDDEVARRVQALAAHFDPTAIGRARSLAEARVRLAEQGVEVLIASATLPDGQAVELAGSDRCRAIVLITSSPDEELTARSRSSRELHFLAEAPEHRHLALLPLRVLEAQKRAEQDHELQSLRDARPASEMLRRLADHVPVMLGFWNREQRCGFANHLYERWFGVPPEAIIGMSMRELLGSVYPLNLPHIEAALRGERRDFERIVPDPAGGPARHAIVSYIPYVPVPQGAVEGFFVLVMDVSELKRLGIRLQESVRRWETLFSILPVGVSIIDGAGQVQEANAALARALGLSREAILDGEYRQLAFRRPDGTPMLATEFATAQARQRHQIVSADLQVIRRDGSSAWLSTIAAPLPDAPESMVVVTNDVTQRRAAEQAVAENEARLRALLDATVEGIITIDDEHRIRTANRAVSKLFGYALDELIGAEIGILMPEGPREQHFEYIARYERTQEARVIGKGREVLGRHKSGAELPLFLSIAVLPPEANVGRYIATLHDLRARHAVEQEKRELENHLRESEKLHAIGRLAGGVAHDFNNLLTVVELCCARILDELPPDSPLCRELEQIRGAGRQGSELVRQLLTFSRPELVSRSTVDLSAVVRRLEPMLRRLLPAHITLHVEASESEPVGAELAHMDQVVMNLVLNARDAMPGGGQLAVTVRSRPVSETEALSRPPLRAGACVELIVRDSGIGMSKAVSERAFEPFFTTKDPGLGTGLGLATVYGIVREAGGHIELSTAPGQGTRVQVWLPRATAALSPQPRPTPQPKVPANRSTLLVVEDQPEILGLVTQVLQTRGYRVLAAQSGEAAIELSRQHPGPIDLVFSDVIMPGQSGPQMLQQVSAIHPRIKVLFASGYSDEALDLSGAGAGAGAGASPSRFEFLAKPYSIDALLSTVARLLESPG